ncbi:MAG: 2-C-methyl-D-erythritol 4-phosphate cytidylyltransferase [Bacilli bacterium]|jgi:2-C-methyl-D-erythritol 4-phosphate cytidylyltransferase
MNIAVLLMAGSGLRLQHQEPKQFISIGGKPLFGYALDTLYSHREIERIVLVVHDDYLAQVKTYCEKYLPDKPWDLIRGGKTRQASVYQAVLHLMPTTKEDDIILLHDAARPFVSEKIIEANLKKAHEVGAVNTAIESLDTLIKIDGEKQIIETLDRSCIFRVQTPQTFTFALLKRAHELALTKGITSASDDAQLVKALPHPVYIVQGEVANFKVTRQSDFELLKAILLTRGNKHG